MEFNLLCTKNAQQAIVRQFAINQSTTTKILDIHDAKNLNIQGFLIGQDQEDDEFLQTLDGDLKFFPIRLAKDFSVTTENFEKMNFDDAKNIFDKMRENWILQNNVSLMEELFKVRTHLLGLYPNNRSSFFEELWFLLKLNLGASNIKLIYNDLIKAKNENEKNKLVKVKIWGDKYPETTPIDEMDEVVLKSYEKDFGNIFEITDYNKEKGQLVICANIKKSPVLIMANVYQLTRIQKALLSSLFDGLNG